MLNKIIRKVRAIANELVIAFFFTTSIIFLIIIIFGPKINETFRVINKVATITYREKPLEKEITINKINKRLTTHPTHGKLFGSIEIPSVSINVDLYQGETLDVLKRGAGHHGGSYFPGEGGTIVIAAHNSKRMFYNLPKVKINDIVTIKTIYGTYKYKITKTEVAAAKKLGENLRISTEKETIMLYTCYPVNTPGYKSRRFVAYGDLVGEENA